MPYNFSSTVYARTHIFEGLLCRFQIESKQFSTSYILTNKLLVSCLPNLTWRSELLVT